MKNKIAFAALLTLALATAANCGAQFPSGAQGTPGPSGTNAFPSRPPADPGLIAKGQAIYDTNCSFCHGEDARGGGEGGPNLLRSDILARDQNGELLVTVVQNGRPNRGMPKFTLSNDDVSNIAAFLHSFVVSSRDAVRNRPATIVLGDVKAGESYFNSKCSSCHSVSGDLKGIASRIPDPRTLQQTWLMPTIFGGRSGGGVVLGSAGTNVPPMTVSVTPNDGKTVKGRIIRIDDFFVSLIEADGTYRSFRRDGAVPKVEVHDPLLPHKILLPVHSDKDIHDVTAYLETAK